MTLFDRSERPVNPVLPDALRTLYGGDLTLPSRPGVPHVVANFVSTLDGVVSYGMAGQAGGGPVSGFNSQDAFVMGLLRSYADAVMFGAGTLHGDPGHVRIAPFIFPQAEHQYAELRRSLQKSKLHPLNVIVTGSGRVDLEETTFHTAGLETLIVTSRAGLSRLQADPRTARTAIRVRSVGEGPVLPPKAILELLHEEFGVRLLLHEGGPTLFGRFLTEGFIDELFLTLAPRVAGRSKDTPRLSFAEGVAFPPEEPGFALDSVKRAGDHLFLRWQVHPPILGVIPSEKSANLCGSHPVV